MSMTATFRASFVLDSSEPCSEIAAGSNRCVGMRDNVFLVLVLCMLIRSGEVLAADQASHVVNDFAGVTDSVRVAPPLSISALPESFGASNLVVQEAHDFSATEFSPRKPTMFDHPSETHVSDMPAVANTGSARTANAWQRLADYRGLGRVRLLTLWENSGSSVSLQAGKGGGPSLQWTSRAMNHGGPTRGLLDKVFSASLAGAGNAMRNSGGPRIGIAASPKLPTRSAASTPVKAP